MAHTTFQAIVEQWEKDHERKMTDEDYNEILLKVLADHGVYPDVVTGNIPQADLDRIMKELGII